MINDDLLIIQEKMMPKSYSFQEIASYLRSKVKHQMAEGNARRQDCIHFMRQDFWPKEIPVKELSLRLFLAREGRKYGIIVSNLSKSQMIDEIFCKYWDTDDSKQMEKMPLPSQQMADELSAMIQTDRIERIYLDAALYLYGYKGKIHPDNSQKDSENNDGEQKTTELKELTFNFIPETNPVFDYHDTLPILIWNIENYRKGMGEIVLLRLQEIINRLRGSLFDENFVLTTLYAIIQLFLRYSVWDYVTSNELKILCLLEELIVEDLVEKNAADYTRYAKQCMKQLIFDVFQFALDPENSLQMAEQKGMPLGCGLTGCKRNIANLNDYESFIQSLDYGLLLDLDKEKFPVFPSGSMNETDQDFMKLGFFSPVFRYEIIGDGHHLFDQCYDASDLYTQIKQEEDIISDIRLFTDPKITENALRALLLLIQSGGFMAYELPLFIFLFVYFDKNKPTVLDESYIFQEDFDSENLQNEFIKYLENRLDEVKRRLDESAEWKDYLLKTCYAVGRYFMSTSPHVFITAEELHLLYRFWRLAYDKKVDCDFEMLILDILRNVAEGFEPIEHYGRHNMYVVYWEHMGFDYTHFVTLDNYIQFLDGLSIAYRYAYEDRDYEDEDEDEDSDEKYEFMSKEKIDKEDCEVLEKADALLLPKFE